MDARDPYTPPTAPLTFKADQTSEMEITYKNTFGDLFVANISLLWRSRMFRWAIPVVMIGASASSAYDISGKFSSTDFIHNSVSFAFSFAFLMTVYSLLFSAYSMVKGGEAIVGPHRLVIDDSGITEETAVNRSTNSWRGIHKINVTRKYIWVYTTPMNLHMIPRRAFPTYEASQAFFERARDAHAQIC